MEDEQYNELVRIKEFGITNNRKVRVNIELEDNEENNFAENFVESL